MKRIIGLFPILLLSSFLLACTDPISDDDDKTPKVRAREWEVINLGPGFPYCLDTHPEIDDRLFLTIFNTETNQYELLLSSDGGLSWDTTMATKYIGGPAFYPTDPDSIYMVASFMLDMQEMFQLYLSSDGGETWNARGEIREVLPPYLWVDPLDINHLWLGWRDWGSWDVGTGAEESWDGGLTWDLLEPSLFSDQGRGLSFIVPHPENPSVIFAETSQELDGMLLLRTEDNFQSYSILRNTESSETIGPPRFDPADSERMLIVQSEELGNEDKIYLSEDGGTDWRALEDPFIDDETITSCNWYGDSVFVLTSVNHDSFRFWALDMESGSWVLNRSFGAEYPFLGMVLSVDGTLYFLDAYTYSLLVYR